MQGSVFLHIKAATNRTLVILIFTIISSASFAQYEESSDTIKIDTAYTPISNEAPPEFDFLNTTDTINYKSHTLADSLVNGLKADEDFWYANQSLQSKGKKKENVPNYNYNEPFYLKQWFRILVWIVIIGGFLAVLIWFLISSDVRLFRKKPSVVYSVSDDALPEDIFSIDYENELKKSLADKNLRLSVRLMYLHVLRLLADRDLIEYKHEKTNSDYLAQLFTTGYYKEFFQLTRHFEYVWYGKFDLSETAFDAIRGEYHTLKSRLQS